VQHLAERQQRGERPEIAFVHRFAHDPTHLQLRILARRVALGIVLVLSLP
jgi:hypothetical protein